MLYYHWLKSIPCFKLIHLIGYCKLSDSNKKIKSLQMLPRWTKKLWPLVALNLLLILSTILLLVNKIINLTKSLEALQSCKQESDSYV